MEDKIKTTTKRLDEKTEFIAVDFFRLLFAIGIVALHLAPMQDINENTDTSSYTFSTFPSSLGGVYAVPIIMYSAEPNHIQIRIHKKYLEDSGAEDTFAISVLEGFYASAASL